MSASPARGDERREAILRARRIESEGVFSMSESARQPAANAGSRRKYVPAVTKRLRRLLYVVFGIVALLGANSVYLASITALEWASRRWGEGLTYQNYFYIVMFSLHLVLGLLLIVPFLVFGVLHMRNSFRRRNRRAVRVGYALFAVCVLVLLSGVSLVRLPGLLELKNDLARSAVYWTHVACPLIAGWLYWLHRLAGPRIKWKIGVSYAGAVAAVVATMVVLQAQDPRDWNAAAPKEGKKYFEPSLVGTRNGKLIPARALANDQYCLRCHEDLHETWFHSVHKLSSFNNPAYLAAVLETREVVLKRDGSVKASRWCAGCHDPVPFLSGAFDDPNYDVVNDPTAHAGITCTACHSITHVNSTRGNADYVIEEPLHYPFAYSENVILQWVNNTLVKAKPSFHKQQFLKPFHKTAEFCSACHKVHLPKELTEYKDFLRGQNHYDSFLLSGVSGGNIRAFYYPKKAEVNCNECHMPLIRSDDFGALEFADREGTYIHDHTFLGANTAIAWFRGLDEVIAAHREFLEDCVRVDLFGVREEGQIDGQLHAPLRPEVPALEPGKSYLLETVIRTLTLGHLFTQGTVDSNEVWMEVEVRSGDRVIGRSGGLDESGEVDPWSHFVNVFMLDKNGNRIDRRNAQDIFVPLYNHQIPPGAGQVVHFRLDVPDDVREPIEVVVRLNYRKFDKKYVDFMIRQQLQGQEPLREYRADQPYGNPLPITVLSEDRIRFAVAGQDHEVDNGERDVPAWQRWNDYGIGLLLEGRSLKQAAAAFAEVERLGRYDGPLNMARIFNIEGRYDEAIEALERAARCEDPPAPTWTMSWLSGLVNRSQGHLDVAERNLRAALNDRSAVDRGFDFSVDYVVINELGLTLLFRAQREVGPARKDARDAFLRQAIDQFQRTLELDAENVTAHYNLRLAYELLGDTERAARHRELHQRYKADDNNRDQAVAAARRKYPAANHAAEQVVIYSLHGKDASASGESVSQKNP